jgi:hypothetical protein
MTPDLQIHDVVALLEDVPAKHFETGQPLQLRRGQVGTVVTIYNPNTVEVEFAGLDGRAYAILPLRKELFIALRQKPEVAAA